MSSIDFVKRVRIVSQLKDRLHGWQVLIYDADTGEQISDVYRAVITLDARELNVVELYYYRHDENGKIIPDETGGPTSCKTHRNFPDVDIYAYEVKRNIE